MTFFCSGVGTIERSYAMNSTARWLASADADPQAYGSLIADALQLPLTPCPNAARGSEQTPRYRNCTSHCPLTYVVLDPVLPSFDRIATVCRLLHQCLERAHLAPVLYAEGLSRLS